MVKTISFIEKEDLVLIREMRDQIYKYEELLQEALLEKTEAYYAIENGNPYQQGDVVINVKNYRTAGMKQQAKNNRIIGYEEAEAQYQNIASVLLGCYVYFACLDFLDHNSYLRVIRYVFGWNMLTSGEKQTLELHKLKQDIYRCNRCAHKALSMRNGLFSKTVSKETKQRFTNMAKETRKDLYNRRRYYHRNYKKKDRNKEFIEL